VEDRNEEPKEGRLARVKSHVYDYRRVYITGVTGIAVGFALRGRPEVVNIVDVFNIKFRSPTNNIIVTALGDPGNIVQCVETGTVYASQNQAARELGVAAARISEHLQGKLPNVKGFHFEYLGKAPVA
jgi:hypothetical protein